MRTINIISILSVSALLILGGCAKPPPPQPLIIPIPLVNYNPVIVVAPDRPDATAVEAIKADDSPESALDTLINYLASVGLYTIELENVNNELGNQNATFRANQRKIKQVIILNQGLQQP